MDKEIERVKI